VQNTNYPFILQAYIAHRSRAGRKNSADAAEAFGSRQQEKRAPEIYRNRAIDANSNGAIDSHLNGVIDAHRNGAKEAHRNGHGSHVKNGLVK